MVVFFDIFGLCLTLKKVDTKVNKNGEYKKKNKRQTGNTFKP